MGFGSRTFGGDVFTAVSPDFEEVYGPDYPLTPDDVPVLENGICRVRYEQVKAAFSLHLWVAGDYVEVGRFAFWRTETIDQYSTLLRPFVAEWTPDRAVIGAAFRAGEDTSYRCDAYLTLQRGWRGPRVELYPTRAAPAKPGVFMRLAPATSGATELGRSSGTVATIASGTGYGDFTAIEPWAYLLGAAPNLALHLAVLQEEAALTGRNDTGMYGAAKSGVSIASPAGAGYLSATLAAGARGDAADDAQNLGRTNLVDARPRPLLVER